tara:strand:- start:217 stop:453 length:237 start_codon:yes stop_codon:yes gene_type:complete
MELEIKLKKKIEYTYTIYKNVSKKAIREECELDNDEDPEDFVFEYIEQVYSDLTELIDDEDQISETDEEFEIEEVEVT